MKMKVQQQMNLKALMPVLQSDYRLAEQLHDRQVELQETLKTEYILPAFDNLLRAGVRPEILNVAMESVEFEETLGAFISELTGIVGRWEMADKLDKEGDHDCGMTLRDKLAVNAMQGMLPSGKYQGPIPRRAYELADEMIIAREAS